MTNEQLLSCLLSAGWLLYRFAVATETKYRRISHPQKLLLFCLIAITGSCCYREAHNVRNKLPETNDESCQLWPSRSLAVHIYHW